MIGPSIDDVRGLNTFSKSYVFIPSAFNTVAVDITEYNLAANDKAAKISALFSILNSHGEAQQPQTIIYCRSPKAAAEIASELVNNGYGTDLNGDYIAWLEKHYGKSWAYVRAIRSSIGIHHGALPRALQQRTIDLFNNKHLQVLICTSTIIEGVNTNAQTVIIFDNRNGTGSIDRFTHNNIKGRAGRMKKYFVGQVHCLEKIPEETFESKVVAIPLGLQGPQSPPNLLVGIDKQHLQDSAESTLKDYLNQTAIPAWLLRKFPSYRIEQLHTLLEKIETLSPYEFRQICARKPNASQIDLMCEALRIVEYRALQYCNLQSRDSDLKLKFSRYLFSLTHQAYVDSIVGWNESHYTTITDRSIAMDRDLKIIRNIFGFTVPRTLNLLQYLVNYVCLKRNLTLSCDYGYVISQFENCHLPSSVAALEEMGIPVQTLSKLNLNRLAQVKMQTIDRYLRKYFRTLPNFDSMDREFISSSLLQTIEVR